MTTVNANIASPRMLLIAGGAVKQWALCFNLSRGQYAQHCSEN